MYTVKRSNKIEIPQEFTPDVIDTLKRIEQKPNVNGVMYFKNDTVAMHTVSHLEHMVLKKNLPLFTTRVNQAVKEILIIQEIMKIVTNLLKDANDEKLVKTTATINEHNPIVDRIMEDDSVEGVLMTNKEGVPILTNISLTHATLFGRALHRYGVLSQMYIKELDPFEEIVVVRINTRKNEMILVPDREFLVVVIQLASKVKVKDKRKL